MLNLVITVVTEEQFILQFDVHTEGEEGQGQKDEEQEKIYTSRHLANKVSTYYKK